MNIEDTLHERGQRYGDFAENARIAQTIKTAIREGTTFSSLGAAQKQALDVIADKISRVVTGDATYTDNWHDIQGYARLAEVDLVADLPASKKVATTNPGRSRASRTR